MTDRLRKCIGCSELKNRDDMIRILKKYDSGELIVSPSNKDFGRSVYICKNKDCIKNALKKGRMSRLAKDKDVSFLMNLLESKINK